MSINLKLGRAKRGKSSFVQVGKWDSKLRKRTETKFSVIHNVSHAKLVKAIEYTIQRLATKQGVSGA